jgi:hypothetical protein
MSLEELPLHYVPLLQHLMQRQRPAWILAYKDTSTDRALLAHQHALQHDKQSHQLPQIVLVLIFPAPYTLRSVFVFNI